MVLPNFVDFASDEKSCAVDTDYFARCRVSRVRRTYGTAKLCRLCLRRKILRGRYGLFRPMTSLRALPRMKDPAEAAVNENYAIVR